MRGEGGCRVGEGGRGLVGRGREVEKVPVLDG